MSATDNPSNKTLVMPSQSENGQQENDDLEKITINLNLWLEKMISKNPEQWIWSHNRWKL